MTTGRGGSAPPRSEAHDEPGVAAIKAAFRAAAVSRRAAAAAAAGPEASLRLRDHVLAAISCVPDAIVSAFLPIDVEIDPRPLMRVLHERGHRVVVPVVRGRGKPLLFRLWAPDSALVTGVFGVAVPPPGAPEHDPDVLIVPLLAFDRRGHRMGYGAGFYDRTLAVLKERSPILAVGVGYAGQEVAEVPTGSHDVPLDLVVTDREIIRMAPR
jgi:5-formyltetrahydrofolate cyclo-ligase